MLMIGAFLNTPVTPATSPHQLRCCRTSNVDPITIAAAFKAATTAIELAKKGVAFYKEIKATGGDVVDVLKDLKEQYHKIVQPSPEQTKQYNEEVKRVQEVAKANPHDALNDIWEQLGVFVDQYDVMVKAYIASETSAKVLYKGDVSLGRRALERLKLRHQLDYMLTEVREQMVYNAPPELGDLWTRFEKMWTQINEEQNVALLELQLLLRSHYLHGLTLHCAGLQVQLACL